MVEKRKERLDRGIKARTDDIFAISTFSGLMYLILPRTIPILVLLLLPLIIHSKYGIRLLSTAMIYGLLALTWDFLASFAGRVSLGHAFFFGLGAYITALMNMNGMPLWISIPLSGLIGGLISTLIILPTLPLRGVYFALATLVFPLLFVRLIVATRILGGTEGLLGLDPFPNTYLEYYLALTMLLGSLFILRRFVNSDIGVVIRAIQEDEQSVWAAGINVTLYRSLAIFIAASITSLAGAYTAHQFMFSGISLLALDISILPIAATIIGGMGSLAGPILGGFILILVGELLRSLGEIRMFIFSGIIALLILARPEGLFNYLQRKYHQFERWIEV